MDYETFGKLVDNEQDMQILEALAATESEQEATMLFDMLTPEQQDYVERLLDDASTDLSSETATVESKDNDNTIGKLIDAKQDEQILAAFAAAADSEQDDAWKLFDALTPEQQDYVSRLVDNTATDLSSETVTVEDKDEDGDLDKATIKSDKDGDEETDEVISEEIIDDNDKEDDDVKVTDNGYKLSDERYKNILNTLRDRLF